MVIIGTPVDEFLNPTMQALARCIDEISPYLRDDQLLVLRSTLYPGTTAWIGERLQAAGRGRWWRSARSGWSRARPSAR